MFLNYYFVHSELFCIRDETKRISCTVEFLAVRICLVSLCAVTTFSLLAGCGAPLTDTAAPVAAHIEIQGTVFGGQQPVVGAHLYLLAANTTGYGNASVSLLNDTSLNSESDGTHGLHTQSF